MGACSLGVQSSRFSIVKGNGEKQLSVYVIHSLPTLMSVVQLWDKGEMVMVCHLVSADTIGYEEALGLDNQVRIYLSRTRSYVYVQVLRRVVQETRPICGSGSYFLSSKPWPSHGGL